MEQGVKLVIMESQKGLIHYSDRIFAQEPGLGYKPVDESLAVILGAGESRAFLETLGIGGEIITTPSHSEDSISVILDDGTAIVGDLEPLEYLAGYEDNKVLKADWDRILGYKPKRVLYAHANAKELD